MASLSVGNLPYSAERENVRPVRIGDNAVGKRIRRVLKFRGLHEFRVGVAGLQRVSFRKALVGANLQRVIPGVSIRFLDGDGAELGIRNEERGAGDLGRIDGTQAGERARRLRRKEIDGGLVARGQLAEILRRSAVDLLRDGEVRAAVADIGHIQEELAGQESLHSERPALRVGRPEARIGGGNRLAQICAQAALGAERGEQAARQRIGKSGDVGDTAVERRMDRGGLREAGLDGDERVDADGAEVDAVPGANHGPGS